MWSVLLPNIQPNWTKYVNRTDDVTLKNCLNNFDTIACIRASVLCLLSLVTGIFCCIRLVHLHMTSSRNITQHHLFLFYIATLHCIVGSIEWCTGWTTAASLACMYLRSFELLVICHFYVTLACRVTHNANDFAARSTALLHSLVFIYFTCFIVLGLVFAQDPIIDCFAYYWLFLSGGHFVMIQLLLLVCLLLCNKINAVCANAAMKRTQRFELLVVLIAFELSAILAVSYHTSMSLLASASDGGCSGVFNHRQSVYSCVRLPYEVFSYLVPIWAILYVFRPDTSPMMDYDVFQNELESDIRRSNSGIILDASALSDGSLLIPANPRSYRPWPQISRGMHIRGNRSSPTLTYPPDTRRRLPKMIRRSMRKSRTTMSVPSNREGLRTIPEEHSGEQSRSGSAEEGS